MDAETWDRWVTRDLLEQISRIQVTKVPRGTHTPHRSS